jgi:twinkle protein
MDPVEESDLIQSKLQCPCDDPSSSFAIYSDGHGHCFAGGCPSPHWSARKLQRIGYEPVEGMDIDRPRDYTHHQRSSFKMSEAMQAILDTAQVRALSKWKVTQATAAHWDYRTRVNSHGEGEHISVYKDEHGSTVGFKVRNTGKDGEGKDFHIRPNRKQDDAELSIGLYGLWLMGRGGKKIILAEGEKDTLVISQLWANKFPVVSPIHGSGGARKDVAQHLDLFANFDEVVICFDMDEPGRKAALEVAKLFPPGKAFIAQLPRKDAAEMHLHGEDQQLTHLLHNAAPYRPDGITSMRELAGEILSPVKTGRSYPWPFLTDWTHGRRDGEVLVLAAGTGVGKSDLMLEIAAHNIRPDGNYLPTAVFNYEAGPQITGKAIAGKLWDRRFHIPDPDGVLWTPEELKEAVTFATDKCAKLFINDHQGATDWNSIKDRLRFLKHSEDIADAFVDPMAALVATEEDERKALDRMMAESKMLAEELHIGLWFNTHVTRPSEGKSHEEGGRVQLKQLRGSNAIGMWASYVFALERDQQGDEEARALTTFRVLKDRYTGDSTGRTMPLRYNTITGRLEVDEAIDLNHRDDEAEAPPL